MSAPQLTRRIGWTIWALIPVAILAWHFGPGQQLMARDLAASRFDAAMALEQEALAAQAAAYACHLDAIEARRATFVDGVTPEEQATLDAALEIERTSYESAADRWETVAHTYGQVETQLGKADADTLQRIRWSKARALVRSGAVFDGAFDLETLLFELDQEADPQRKAHTDDLARATREELAAAHYFGARMLRLDGKPASEWRAQATKARQHFRYLAEAAARDGADPATVTALEDNVERVINLEQMDFSQLEGQALPKQSPRKKRGGEPRDCSSCSNVSQRPPRGKKDGRGAAGAGPIGLGW